MLSKYLILGMLGCLCGGTAMAAPATPASPSRPSARSVVISERWKSPVESESVAEAARSRWMLGELADSYADDRNGLRWRLQGPKVKVRMPLSLH